MATATTYYATGRRKTAVARVYLLSGKGKITVNGRDIENYFPRETSRMIIAQPLELAQQLGQLDAKCRVNGGGIAAQAEAVRHGISRALLKLNAESRPALKKAGLLTRDARKKERKKPGQPGARKRFQYSKR